jgi:hypothetical protein
MFVSVLLIEALMPNPTYVAPRTRTTKNEGREKQRQEADDYEKVYESMNVSLLQYFNSNY